jgi:beta-glucanase (GH16 family)
MAGVSTDEVGGDGPADVDGAAPRRSRRRLVAIVVVVALVATVAGALVYRATRGDDGSGWPLVWSDEFDGSTLDPARWSVEDRSTFGDGNLELACLMDRPDNVVVQDGRLSLVARRETPPLACKKNDPRFPDGREFSSGFVSTQDRASWRYARVEIRAALPTTPGQSAGLWPALWMRPDDLGLGEIDIMEALGTGNDRAEADKIHQTLHYDYDGTKPKVGHVPELPAGFDTTQFHTYAVQTQPGRIDWLVDGEVTWTVDREKAPWVDDVLASPYFLRMNLAVGGRWPGDPDASTALPAAMQVDWVRVYQRP